MALRLRRGTDAERLLITPADGEMIWTTDTQELYVGNGTTVGGIRITGATNDSPDVLTRNLDLASNTIFGSGDINISGQITTSGSITATGTVTAASLVGDGSQIYNLSAANLDVSDLVVEGGTYYINLVGPDSASVLDSQTSVLNIDTITTDNISVSEALTVGESVTANQFFGDVIGELHAEDSTIIINRFGELFTNKITSDELQFRRTDTQNNLIRVAGEQNEGGHIYERRTATDLGTYDWVGRVKFDKFDTTDNSRTNFAFISASKGGMFLSHDSTGVHGGGVSSSFVDGKVSLAGFEYRDGYQVNITGNTNINNGKLNLGSVAPADVTTPENGDLIYNPGANRLFLRENDIWKFPLTVDSSAVYLENTLPIQQANYSTVAIGIGLSAAQEDGVLLFNTTEQQLQVYAGEKWNNVASDGGTFKGDVNGSVGLDDSTTIIDGTDGSITAPATVKFGEYSTAERDQLTGLAGMVVFNTTTAKLQVFNGSTWLDLH